MNNKKKVSVIIPVYNAEAYIEECLLSVQNQSMTDFEVLCVDDRSTDESLRILQKYESVDERFHAFSLENNAGVGAARNYAMHRMNAEYMVFLDADDYWERDSLEVLCHLADDSGAECIAFSTDFVDDNEVSVGERICIELNEPVNGREFFDLASENEFMSAAPWLYFWRQDYIKSKNIEFIKGITNEDVMFTLPLVIEAERVMSYPRKLHHYRIHDNSITQTMDINRIKSMLIVYENLIQYWLSSSYKTEIYKGVVLWLEYLHRCIRIYSSYLDGVTEIDSIKEENRYWFDAMKKYMPTYKYLKNMPDEFYESAETGRNIYVFGDGILSLELLDYMNNKHIGVSGIVVTQKKQDLFEGLKVYSIDEMALINKDSIIIIAVSFRHSENIKKMLEEKGFHYIYVVNS